MSANFVQSHIFLAVSLNIASPRDQVTKPPTCPALLAPAFLPPGLFVPVFATSIKTGFRVASCVGWVLVLIADLFGRAAGYHTATIE